MRPLRKYLHPFLPESTLSLVVSPVYIPYFSVYRLFLFSMFVDLILSATPVLRAVQRGLAMQRAVGAY